MHQYGKEKNGSENEVMSKSVAICLKSFEKFFYFTLIFN